MTRKFRRESSGKRPGMSADGSGRQPADSTGLEAACLRSWIDSRAVVTVVLTTGERLRGRIRYYDRELFSLRQAGGGPNMLLRKDSVRYISED